MSFLDLYQGDQDQAARIQPNEGRDLPSGFDANFHAAWSDGLLFSQSVARENARAAVLGDYVSEIRQKTGRDLSQELNPDAESGTIGPGMFDQANARVAKMKADYPDLDLNPLSEDEINSRALAKAQSAHRNYEALQAGEKTAGGSFGSFLGSAAAGAADPINIVALPIAPEAAGVGILSTALRWGALAGVSQAAIEFASDDFKEQVQPGYTESGAPLHEIGGAFLGGAVVGGSIKALGNAWSRVKTGQWPTSVRDAGNVIESEANIASTNPLPGVEGEVAHREALVKTIDDILAGRPVDVGAQVTPELRQAAAEVERAQTVQGQPPSGMPKQQLMLPLEPERDPLEMARSGELNSERAFQISDELKQSSKATEDQILGADADRWRKAIKRSEMYSNRADDKKAAEQDAIIAEIEGRHSLEDQGMLYGQGMPDHTDPEGWRDLARDLQDVEGSRADAVRAVGFKLRDLPDPSKPLSALDRERLAVIQRAMTEEAARGGDQIQFLKDAFRESGERYGGGHDAAELIADDIERLKRLMENPPPAKRDIPKIEGPQPPTQSADEMNKTLTSPDHQDAIRADIDREIAEHATNSNIRSEIHRYFNDQIGSDEISARAKNIIDKMPADVKKAGFDVVSVGGGIKDADDILDQEMIRKLRSEGSEKQVAAAAKFEGWLKENLKQTELQVPGIDEQGNHTMVSVDKAMDQVDAYKAAAEQIQACANPAQEAAE